MRPQTRPFTVQLKSRRRPPAGMEQVPRAVDDISPDDLPERDVRSDLGTTSIQTEAWREASKLFNLFNPWGGQMDKDQDQTPQPVEATPDAPSPRLLPDLTSQTREEERVGSAHGAREREVSKKQRG